MSAATEIPSDPFDRVVLVDGVASRTLLPDEFLALPLSVRIRCVLERTVTFYLGNDVVDPHAALDALRRRAAR